MIGVEVMGWFSLFWDTAGAGVIAGLIIVFWDLLRIWFQSKWLIKKLSQPAKHSQYHEILKQLEAINRKIGADNESGHTSSDQA